MDMRPARRTVSILASACLALALGACADDDAGPAAAPSTHGGSATAGPVISTRPPSPTPPSQAPTGTPPTGPPTREPSAGELVTVRRSGGLAGVAQTVAVGTDGGWTFTDLRQRSAKRGGQLTDDQRLTLRKLLARPALVKEAKVARQRPPKCADGFVYTLVSGEVTVRWSDCAAAGRPETASAVVDLLEMWTPLRGGI